MAAEAMTLPDDRRDAGFAILQLTDNVGFGAAGAGWAFTQSTGSWRFYLFTHLIDTQGPLWVWERLLKAFQKFNLPACITPLDIMLASPDEWLYRDLLAEAGDSVTAVTMVMGGGELEESGRGIDAWWLYRLQPEQALLEEAAHTNAASRFDLEISQLMAA